MKSVKIVFVTLMQDEWNRVNYMDYISISDEKSTSQHAISNQNSSWNAQTQ